MECETAGGGRTATMISLGLEHSCALLDDQTVKCWGRNDQGQLGLGDTNDRGLDSSTMGDALPSVALGEPALAVAAGDSHTCALLESGGVKCWGRNDAGQLGQGDAANRGDEPGELEALSPVDLGPGATAIAIDAGTHTCVILSSGGIKCWGPNTQGQLGLGDTLPRGITPGDVAALPVIDVGD